LAPRRTPTRQAAARARAHRTLKEEQTITVPVHLRRRLDMPLMKTEPDCSEDGADLLLLHEPGRFRRFATSNPFWGLWLSVATFSSALITLFVAYFTPASATKISIPCTLNVHGHGLVHGPTLKLYIGYLLELNHGLFYLVLAPFFVAIAASFVSFAGRGLVNLERCGYLSAQLDGQPVTIRTAIGRRPVSKVTFLFHFPIWSWCLIGVASINYFHALDWCRARDFPINNDLGYMQAPFALKWVSSFNSKVDSTARWATISTTEMEPRFVVDLSSWLETHWSALDPEDRESWAPAIRVNGDRLQSEFPPVRLESHITLDAGYAVSKGLVQFANASLSNPEKSTRSRTADYWLFFALSNAMEGAWVGFCTWAGFKIFWWLAMLGAGIFRSGIGMQADRRKSARHYIGAFLEQISSVQFRLEPLFEDPRKQFGLSELAEAYNRIAALLAIGATVCFLAWFSNNVKSHPFSSSATGWYVMLIAEVFVGGAFTYATLILFPGWLYDRRDLFLQELRTLSRRSNTDDRLEVERRKGLVCEQATWPKADATFNRLMLMTVAFVVLPWCLMFSTVPTEVQRLLNVTVGCEKLVVWVAEKTGQLPIE
jgi:hypothetical protein